MKQCFLRRGSTFLVVWLPVQFAVVGKYVRLLDVDGWKVERVFQPFQKSVDVPRGYFAGGVCHG